jgi:hypothetical protein
MEMFNGVTGPQQALLFQAIILCGGFTIFILFAVVPLVNAVIPLVRLLKEQNSIMLEFLKSLQSEIDAKNLRACGGEQLEKGDEKKEADRCSPI